MSDLEFLPGEYSGLDTELEALWEVVCECGHKDCERPSFLYTMCSHTADVSTVRDAVYRANLTFACGSHYFLKRKNRIHPKRIDW